MKDIEELKHKRDILRVQMEMAQENFLRMREEYGKICEQLSKCKHSGTN